MRQVYALLGLAKRYGAERLDDACQDALAVDMIDVYRLRRLLDLAPSIDQHRTARQQRSFPSRRFLRPAQQFAIPFAAGRTTRPRRETGMTPDIISPDLRTVLRDSSSRGLLDTFPERLALARQQKMPHQDFLLLVSPGRGLAPRQHRPPTLRAQKAHLDPHAHQLENWDDTAKVTFDRELLNELVSLRFIEAHHHVAIVGHVGVGKTFLAHALGHVACRRGYSVLAVRADRMLKTSKHARLANTYEAELRKLIAVDLLIVDDFALDAMDAQESRDTYEIFMRAAPRRLDDRHLEPRAR